MNLSYEPFRAINVEDGFFDSLKADYREFAVWFARKANEHAYVWRGPEGDLGGFLYLKPEDGAVADVEPVLTARRRLKIGTFKIDAHGTRLGERFMKKVFDRALAANVDEIYVTVFPKYNQLISLLTEYGFKPVGTKRSSNGEEIVLLRDLRRATGNVSEDYPYFMTGGHQYALLGIYPQWHTRLFPDSKLANEAPDIVKDVSHTNSIHKVYLCKMDGVLSLKAGDVLLIYRTKDPRSSAPAHYTSVVTSVCVIEETRHMNAFGSLDDFLAYARPYSVFTEAELKGLWRDRKYPYILRFTYNAAFTHRVTRAELLEKVGLPADAYYGFLPLTLGQLTQILVLGQIHENLAVN